MTTRVFAEVDDTVEFDADARTDVDELVETYVDESDVHDKMKVMVIHDDIIEVNTRCATRRAKRADDVSVKRTTQMND